MGLGFRAFMQGPSIRKSFTSPNPVLQIPTTQVPKYWVLGPLGYRGFSKQGYPLGSLQLGGGGGVNEETPGVPGGDKGLEFQGLGYRVCMDNSDKPMCEL